MRVLVTGGAGFIGSHIVDALVTRGHTVCVVDNLSSGRRENVNSAARLHVVDITSPDLSKVMDSEKPDIVYHEAAQMDVRKSVADPRFDATVNILGGLNLYENCVRIGVKKVIFASTGGAIYGEQEAFPATEMHLQQPLSPYGIAKLANEKYLYFYRETYGLAHVALRYANVYGPRQNPHGEAGVVAIFASKLLAGVVPTINGTGKQTRDYVYVGDVAAANVAALEYDGTDVFNVGTAEETDVNELFNLLRDAVGTDIAALHGEGKAGEQMRSVIDWSKAHRVLGWTPKTTLAEGLKKTVEWFRAKRVAA
jgi:UDP-glucose 4-epimerase